ncbi:MAG: pyrroloquinoline quinone biosynthesis protein PqqE [Burkholderiales bacterium]
MNPSINPPLWLLAEVTYKCPLHCVFCSNPVDYAHYDGELTTDEWVRVLSEGRAMGAAQLGLSGGEPLMRDDLEIIVGEARKLGYYSNLITSGIGLNEKRIAKFKENGLDHIQLSFQDSTRALNDFLSSTKTFELKSKIAKLIKQYDYPMVLNVVLHRMNIDHVKEILEMAESMEAEYVELANTQYYGWAMLNRDHLLPSLEQIRRAEQTVNEFRQRIGDKMKIYFVVPDYYETRPKACMNGWGSVFITVTADGVVLPCHEARMLPGLSFPNVRDTDMISIWYDSQAFNEYRGDSWMKQPCRTCPEKTKDFGGCRCQAFMLTGDATNADPVCSLSPHHEVITDAIRKSQQGVSHQSTKTIPIIFRDDANSRIHGKPSAKQPA